MLGRWVGLSNVPSAPSPALPPARSVKWLARVVASEEEAQGHFQQKDYKVWTSNVNFGDTDRAPAPQR